MKTIIIDAREPFEFEMGHVKGAVNLPAHAFLEGMPSRLQDVPHDTPIIVYCRSGARSNVVAQLLHGHGFSNVTNGISQLHVEKQLAKK